MKKKNASRFSKITTAALLISTLASPIGPYNVKAEEPATTPAQVSLRLLETTDLHANVMDYDYYKDAQTNDFGLARTAQLIKAARDENPNSMLFDAGDLIQGNPLADYVAKVKGLAADETHPVIDAMNYLKYDAGILGNHEFNYGIDYLENVKEEANFPMVNANIYVDDKDDNPENDQNRFTPYEIIDKVVKDKNGNDQTIKVGVIGFAPPQIMQWDKDHLTGKVIAKDIVETAKKFIPEMRTKGADVIVAIAHSGCDITVDGQKDAENAVYSLAKVSGIDALLFGHAHLNFPGDASFNNKEGIDNKDGHIHDVPAVEAGYWGNNLGVMDLELEKQEDGKWKVTSSKAANRPLVKTIDGKKVPQVTGADEEIVKLAKDEHEGTLSYVRGKIGETSAPMYSYFARVQDDPTIQIVNNAQKAYVEKWIADKLPEYKEVPVLSAGAPFKAGRQGPSDYTNILAGDLSIKSANDLYLYPNTLKAVELTGAQVKEWLEMSAGQFNKIDPNKSTAQDIINYAFQPFNYDVIDGLKYEIDITQPAKYDLKGVVVNPDANRIVNLTMADGSPLDLNQKFVVVTNNYRASGGGDFPGLKGGVAKIVVDSPDENREVLMKYIEAQGTVNPSADQNWKIKSIDKDVFLTFRSSPAAVDYAKQSETVAPVGTVVDGANTWGTYELKLAEADYVRAQILGINDFHGQIDTTKTVSGKKAGRADYLATYLKQRKATNTNTLSVHSGDAVGASSPTSALLQDEPTIRILNEIGFDVATLGNHEFDEGVAELKRMLDGGSHPKTEKYEAKYGKFEGANFPYVAANVLDEKTNEPLIDPYFVKEVGGVKVGFIGVVYSDTPSIVIPSGVAGVKFTDEVEAINKYTAVLKEQGVKSIVVLAHNPGSTDSKGVSTGEVVDFANQVDDEVDVIFGAHNHAYLNGTVDGKLLVQAYASGTAFADVDLKIDTVTKDIVTKSAEIVTTFQDGVNPDPKIKEMVDGYVADVEPIITEVVGQSAIALTDDQNAAGESLLGNVIADAMKTEMKTDFAFMNPGGIRADIDAGPITWGELFTTQPFGNDLVKMTLTGAQVRDLLNQQFTPSKIRMLQLSGLKYTWTNNLPFGEKVLDIYLLNGEKINPTADYTVTVNNFMAGGGDNYTALLNGKNKVIGPTDLEGLVNYVKAQTAPLNPTFEGRATIDATAPVSPTVLPVTDTDVKIKGTSEKASKVVAKSGEKLLGEGTVKEDGNFEFSVSSLIGVQTLSVTSTDVAGNISEATVVNVKDTTAPNKPVVNPVSNKSLEISGTAEAGAHIVINDEKGVKHNLVADEKGYFIKTLTTPYKQGSLLYVFAIDKSFNMSPMTMVTVGDKTAPDKAFVNAVSNLDSKVTGKAEIFSTVTVKKGSVVLGKSTTDSKGNFSVTLATKQAAGTVLEVFVTDAALNTSGATAVKVVDKIAPVKPVVNPVSNLDKKVTGKTESGAMVVVKAGANVLGTAVASPKDGYFTVTLKSAQKIGTVLTITATDKDKNTSIATKITVADKTAPSKPTVNSLSNLDKKVTGKTEGGALVVIKTGSTVLGSTVASSRDGSFSVTLKSALSAGTAISVTATDKYKNTSDATKITVVDKVAPSSPKVNKIKAYSTNVTGSAEAYSYIIVKSGNTVLGTAVTNSKGIFSVKISRQKGGTILDVSAKDKAGNVSTAKKVSVQR